jgi:hypothetical protein
VPEAGSLSASEGASAQYFEKILIFLERIVDSLVIIGA